jgi:GNAT superfamily N-acetyltransferase
MLFATASLARRLERADVTLLTEGADASRRRLAADQLFIASIAGGAAVYAGPGSPLNKVAGLGFDGVPDEDELSRIEAAFEARGAPVQAEVSSLADPAVAALLTRRGYVLMGFENVLGLPLDAEGLRRAAARPPGAGVTISLAGAADSDVWMDTVTTGFLHADTFDGPASHESFDRDVLERVFGDTFAARGFERYLAWRGGAVAGGASLRMQEGVAQLCGAATLPEHRRQGVQTALLRYRLEEAARRGCDVAVVTTLPGSKSQQNVQGFGFELLYARAVLVRSRTPEGAGA